MNKWLWITIGLALLFACYCYLIRVGEVYRNGVGEKKAIILAGAIAELHKDGSDSLNIFFKKTSHFYSDDRGNPYEISVGDAYVEIFYKPKPSWISKILERDHQELRVSWAKGEELKIQSSIEKL